jgi:hypothetical protein
MRLQICGKVLLAGAWIVLAACGGWAKGAGNVPNQLDKLDLAATYNAFQSNVVAGSHFWMNGGSAQVGVRFAPGWSCIADVAGQHTANMASTGIGLDLVAMTFGPQYAVRVRRAVLFGQARFGMARGSSSLFPSGAAAPTSDTGATFALGGGIDLPVQRRLSVRVAHAEWERTQLNNLNSNAQNSLRLSTGLVVHLR